MATLTNKKKNIEYFDNLMSMADDILSEQDIIYLKKNFESLNPIQLILANKGFQQLKIDKYLEQANKQSMSHTSLFNKINYVITNIMGV